MGKISFEALRPEMKLAGDVIERTGRVLLRAGTEITEKHLDILRKWGVTEVDAEERWSKPRRPPATGSGPPAGS